MSANVEMQSKVQFHVAWNPGSRGKGQPECSRVIGAFLLGIIANAWQAHARCGILRGFCRYPPRALGMWIKLQQDIQKQKHQEILGLPAHCFTFPGFHAVIIRDSSPKSFNAPTAREILIDDKSRHSHIWFVNALGPEMAFLIGRRVKIDGRSQAFDSLSCYRPSFCPLHSS